MGLVQEIELVRAAREVILTVLTDPENTYHAKVQLARWVIENIWTPELEPID